jgi:hypothetical protein
MQSARTLASLFEEVPRQWGLRGDPHLWQDMKTTLGNAPYPATEEQFAVLLEQAYQQLTGGPLTGRDPVFVERYNHGGMSGGYVSPQFWAETAIPLLRTRYRDAA